MAIVAVVLLIACANLANLMLARAAARRHELSVRLALGASRGRLARQLLAESLLLAAAGALLGLAFAQWSARLLVRQISTWSQTVFLDLTLDWRVLAFTIAVATGTALLFGVAPAWFAASAEPNDALKSQGRALSAGRRALWRPLVVLQVTLSLVLLVAAGLFVRTFARLSSVDLGFDRDAVLVATVDASRAAPAVSGKTPEEVAEETRAPRAALVQSTLDAASRVPGVSHAAVSVITPLSNMTWQNTIEVPGAPPMPARQRSVHVNFVTPGWFATYGTRLIAGRDFDSRDRLGSPPVVIVNQAFVKKFFAGREPLGRVVRQEGRRTADRPAMEVVGLVQDAVYRSLRDEAPPTMYLPLMQGKEMPASVNISVRAATGSPARLTRGVADALTRVDPRLSLTFRPLELQIDASLTRERILALLSGFFGGLALLLAALGLYGVTAYTVARQRTEIGIRMALGADPRRVVRGVVGGAAGLVAAGIVLGAAISLWASKLVASLLYGLEPRDVTTVSGAAVTLAAIGALAAWLPARRAARIDPASVLREG